MDETTGIDPTMVAVGVVVAAAAVEEEETTLRPTIITDNSIRDEATATSNQTGTVFPIVSASSFLIVRQGLIFNLVCKERPRTYP